jgi:hypothetical protein
MSIKPSTLPATIGQLSDAFELPDVSGMDISAIEPDSLVDFVAYNEERLLAAATAFAEVTRPIREALEYARKRIEGAIIDAGGKALPHDTFDVRLEQKTEPQKRIDVLRRLKGVLPDDLYHEAVFIKSLDVAAVPPNVIDDLVEHCGAKPTWDANLTKLNKHARDFGGTIAEIIEEGSPRLAVGSPRLTIKARESALKSVS